MSFRLAVTPVPGAIRSRVIDILRQKLPNYRLPVSKEEIHNYLMFKSEGAAAKPGDRILCFTDPKTNSDYTMYAILRVGYSDFCIGSAPGFSGFCGTRFSAASAAQALMLADLYLASSRLNKEQKIELKLVHTIAADREVSRGTRMVAQPQGCNGRENKDILLKKSESQGSSEKAEREAAVRAQSDLLTRLEALTTSLNPEATLESYA